MDYGALSGHEFKVREMEQQVCGPTMNVFHMKRRLTFLIGRDLAVAQRVGCCPGQIGGDAEDQLSRRLTASSMSCRVGQSAVDGRRI